MRIDDHHTQRRKGTTGRPNSRVVGTDDPESVDPINEAIAPTRRTRAIRREVLLIAKFSKRAADIDIEMDERVGAFID